ncbi:MAG: hypothetical protein QOH69_2553 [Actinomycetota bacterium]|jgi:septal ring factor EnvC (AmiA/AmiB activator)|nr:hypothetical protein [Actinomycetota bacterium]
MDKTSTRSNEELESELADARLAIASLRSQLKAAEIDRNEFRQLWEAAQSQNAMDRHQLFILRRSLSWRLTRFLRVFKRRVRPRGLS